jgi:iron complex outermembrane receptor protein
VYAKYADNENLRTEAGGDSLTGWRRAQTGFRADWGSPSHNFTLQGDAFNGRLHQQGTENIKISGANLNGKINRTLDGGSTLSLQAY